MSIFSIVFSNYYRNGLINIILLLLLLLNVILVEEYETEMSDSGPGGLMELSSSWRMNFGTCTVFLALLCGHLGIG